MSTKPDDTGKEGTTNGKEKNCNTKITWGVARVLPSRFSPSSRIMAMRFHWFSLVFFTAVWCTAATCAQGQHARAAEQSHFSAEDSAVKRPVKVPEDVMALLRNDETVQSVLESENTRAEQLPQEWFSASVVHLSSANRADLVVVGNAPVSGGNTALFWVFGSTTHGHRLLLALNAHDLILKKTYWKAYREIEALGITAGQVWTLSYRCNGDQYRRYKKTSKRID